MAEHDPPPVAPAWSRTDFFALMTIGLVALVLRLFQIGSESLWIDEWSTVQLAHSPVIEILKDRAASVNPPLYFVLMRGWVLAFGDAEWALRLPSALFSTATVVASYALARRLGGIKAAMACSALIATSVFHITYAQEARGYALLTLLAIASLWSFLAMLEGSTHRFERTTYVLTTSALLYTHFYGLFVLLAEWLTYVWARLTGVRHPSTRSWMSVQTIIALTFLPWSVFLITQYRLIQEGYWIPRPTWGSVLESMLVYGNNRPAVLFSVMVLAILGGIRIVRASPSTERATALTPIVLLGSVATFPLLIPFAVSQFSTPIYYTRYTIAGSLGLFLLAGVGVSCFRGYAAMAVLAALVAVSEQPIVSHYQNQTKEPWREVSRMLDREVAADDVVLFNDGSYASLFKNYYSSRPELVAMEFNLEVVLRTEQSSGTRFSTLDELEHLASLHKRIWLVLCKPNDTRGAIRDRLMQLRLNSSHRMYRGIEVYAFDRLSRSAGQSKGVPNM